MKKSLRWSISNLSHEEVGSSTSGWILFIFGILLASFLGGGIRAFFSSAQLRYWIEEEMSQKTPKFQLKFSDVHIMLSEGAWPSLGVFFKDLEISSKNKCEIGSELIFNQVYLPINVLQFFSGNLQFGNLRGLGVDFIHRKPDCSEEEKARLAIQEKENLEEIQAESLIPKISERPPSPYESRSSQKKVSSKIKKLEKASNIFHLSSQLDKNETPLIGFAKTFFANRLEKELENSKSWFQTVEIKKFRWIQGDTNQVLLKVERFLLDVTSHENEAKLSAEILPFPETHWGATLPPLDIRARVKKTLVQVFLKGRFNEGKLNATMNIDLMKGDFQLHQKWIYFPVSKILEILNELGWVKESFSPKLMWVNCEVNWFSNFFDKLDKVTGDVEVHKCQISGPDGNMAVGDIGKSPAPDILKQLKIQFQNFSLEKLIGFFHLPISKKIIINYGVLNGWLTFHGSDRADFKGDINGVDIIFSKWNQRRLQTLRNVRLKLERAGDRLSGQVDNIDVVDGKFQGVMSLNMSLKKRQGHFQVNIDEFQLNKEIDKILFHGRLSPFSVYGRGEFSQGSSISWEGSLGAKEIISERWKIQLVKVFSEFKERVLHLKVKVKGFFLSKSSYLYEKLEPLLLSSKERAADLNFRNPSLELFLNEKELTWDHLKLQAPELSLNISSAGRWNYGGEIKGWLSLDNEKYKLLEWQVEGTNDRLKLIPSLNLLKRLAAKESSIKVPETNDENIRMETLDKILARDRYSRIKKLGQDIFMEIKKRVSN